jgi:ABC-type Zn uptake system ZnuABC Zn-binding protein ZnuA
MKVSVITRSVWFNHNWNLVDQRQHQCIAIRRELADLVDQIHATGAKAILLETGANPQLASQIAEETGIRVVSNIYTHSLTTSDGPAPSYLEMMRYNTSAIVAALQGN